MTKRRRTRRALINSVISLLICFSMLLGTTFAWFTDSVESLNNVITAGNLDIEVYDANNKSIEDRVKLFDDVTLWEPGVVAWENLTVANEGTLALKYQMAINFNDENTVEGNGLSKILKVAVVDDGVDSTITKDDTGRTALINSIKEWKPMADFSEVGELLPANNSSLAAEYPNIPIESKTYGIVIYWEPSAEDNNWNVNNEKFVSDYKEEENNNYLHINLGVNVYATQLVAEDDSFGPDYDEDAVYADAYVDTDEELLAAIEDSDVKVIAISGQLTYDWGGNSYENSKALLMKGKTIVGDPRTADVTTYAARSTNENSITFAGYGSANPIVDVTLKNITVIDKTVGDKDSAWEHGHLEFTNLTAKNVKFADSIMLDGNSTLTNCTVDNQINSWYGVWIEGGNTVLENCTFTGTRAVKIHEAYGTDVASVLVDGCEFILSEKPGVVIGDLNANTAVTITNNVFDTQPGDAGLYFYESDTDVTTFDFTESNNVRVRNVSDNDGLDEAVANGNNNIALSAGDFNLPTTTGDVTISGTKDTVITIDKPKADKVTLNGVTVVGSGNYTGIQHSEKVVYENCVVKGVQFLYAEDVLFDNCTIDLTEKADYIWTYGAKNVTFNNCTFNTKGKAILIYSEDANLVTNVTVKDCTFNATESALASGATAAAIEIDSSLATNGHYTLTTENNTVDSDFAGEWRIKKSGANNTTVNDKVYNAITLDGSKLANGQDDFNEAVKAGEENITLAAGTYTFPDSDFKAGTTLVCEEGTVFEGNSKLNIKGATVIGATFSNPNGTAVDQTINGTFKDCTFKGANGLRWCYAGENVVFENCVFDGDVYGVHFDGGANKVLFKNCTISGFNAMGGAITNLIMDGCTFKANNRSAYNGINLWGTAELKNCTFVFDDTADYEWVDLLGSSKTLTIENCVVTDGTTTTDIVTIVGNYGDNNTIIIDGVTVDIPNMS